MSLFKSIFNFSRLWDEIWSRIALMCGLAVVVAVVTPFFSPLIPQAFADRIDEDAVTQLVSILTNSMLVVSTFSLTAMVSAHHNAANVVTPRAHRLLRSDGLIHSILATYLSAFVFALTSIFIIKADFYNTEDFAALYVVVGFVIARVVWSTIRWVSQLSSLGTLESTADRIEAKTVEALHDRLGSPFMGGRAAVDVPSDAIDVRANRCVFVQAIDTKQLAELAEQADAIVHVRAVPGDWLLPGDTLMSIETERLTTKMQSQMSATMILGSQATFTSNPVFGMTVLTEGAERALSPAVNDPGTAVHILRRQMTILSEWEPEQEAEEVDYPRLRVPAMSPRDLLDAAFEAIARDGAAFLEVQIAIQDNLAQLSKHADQDMARAARAIASRAVAYASQSLPLEQDKVRLRAMGRQSEQPTEVVTSR
ncbi:DUF2254 domain-containing protein [Jannaschia donghaensis]|uniref:DUF2254 domain-containing protein n=1 Tax=Jannaschia donghaensis TaxID=420998 RepID=A0A0M6YJR9_9RHOB|nr:DUF2254 family protein [Jannaschia donghaensis]CTQ49753.1 hypothetical protein JDO7802_01769 [Jannaschia donghaensis]